MTRRSPGFSSSFRPLFRPSARLFRRGNWKRGLVSFAILLLLAAVLGRTLSGRVTTVNDGDTLTMREGMEERRVRLYGIDCPELDQPGGEEAREAASALAHLERVRLDIKGRDHYGRDTAVVSLPDGKILNEELLRLGLAWVYDAYCHEPRCLFWRKLELEAREKRLGIWRDEHPVPPWTWRAMRRR